MKIKIITPKEVALVASSISKKPIEQIRSQTRKASVVAVRDICFKICKEKLGMVQDDIAEYFGKNRSSIAHGLQRADRKISKLPQYQKLHDAILNNLKL